MGISSALGTAAFVPAGYGFRNLIINGAMQVHQRGTSKASITADSYNTADRWSVGINTLGTWTQTVENDAPTGSGFRKSLKMLCTTADASPASSDEAGIVYKFEGQNLQSVKKGTASAEQLTLTFWVKSNVTGTYIVELMDDDNSNRHVSLSYTVSASATWEKKTLVFPADTTGEFDNDNAQSMRLHFWFAAGSNYTSGSLQTSWGSLTQGGRAPGQVNLASATNNYWQITGVQLEVGPVATAYEFKPIDVEIAQCQRYYCRYEGGAAYSIYAIGFSRGTDSADIVFHTPVALRTQPSSIEYSNVIMQRPGVATVTITSMSSGDGASLFGGAIYITGSFSSNQTYFFSNNNNTSGYFAFNAEL